MAQLIWWYADANWQQREEYDDGSVLPVWSNFSSTSTFTPAETYQIKSDAYRNAWDNSLANAFWGLANELWAYSNFANTSLNSADALLNYIRWNEQNLQSVAWNTYNYMIWDLQNTRDYVNRMFWENGELTKEVNKYYDDLWNYLQTDAWRQAAEIAAQWVHTWASLGSLRAQESEAYNQSFQRYLQAKEQQINAKQQIASNLINYMSTLRQEYWDTANKYVIDLYKRANDYYNAIAQSAAADINQYNQLRASTVGKWSWTSTDSYLSQILNWFTWPTLDSQQSTSTTTNNNVIVR